MPLLFVNEKDALGEDLYCELFGQDACSSVFGDSNNNGGVDIPPQPVMFKVFQFDN